MKTGPQGMAAVLLSALMAGSAQAVEMMNESDLGGVHINAGNVLNIVGPTAAGGDAPPIQQPAAEQAGLTMALGLMASEPNRPARRVEDERNILSLIFPELDVAIPRQRSVASPASDGQVTWVIQPQNYQVNTFQETLLGQPVINMEFDVRVDQIQWQGVRFPEQVISQDGFNQTLHGLEFQARGRLRQNFD